MAQWRRHKSREGRYAGVCYVWGSHGGEYSLDVIEQLLFVFGFQCSTCHIVIAPACVYNLLAWMQDERYALRIRYICIL